MSHQLIYNIIMKRGLCFERGDCVAKNGSAYFFGSGPHVSYPFTVLIFTLHTLLRWTSTLNQFVKMFSISPSASSLAVAQCTKMGKKCNFRKSPVGRIGQILTWNSEERAHARDLLRQLIKTAWAFSFYTRTNKEYDHFSLFSSHCTLHLW